MNENCFMTYLALLMGRGLLKPLQYSILFIQFFSVACDIFLFNVKYTCTACVIIIGFYFIDKIIAILPVFGNILFEMEKKVFEIFFQSIRIE